MKPRAPFLMNLALSLLVYISTAKNNPPSNAFHPENPLAQKRLEKLTQPKRFNMIKNPPKYPVGKVGGDDKPSTQSNNKDVRVPAIKVLRNNKNKNQVSAPPCSSEIDLFCGAIRDFGGTYKEMQACLLINFDELGEKCQFLSNASKYCDFDAIRDVCGHNSSKPHLAANCIENFLQDHEIGKLHKKVKDEKVLKAFLSFSHIECIGILRNMSNIDDHTYANSDGILVVDDVKMQGIVDDEDENDLDEEVDDDDEIGKDRDLVQVDASGPSLDLDSDLGSPLNKQNRKKTEAPKKKTPKKTQKFAPPISMSEFAHLFKDELNMIENEQWKKNREKQGDNIIYTETDIS